MAELQTIAAVIGCADVCFRVFSALAKFADETARADSTAESLKCKVGDLRDMTNSVNLSLHSRVRQQNRPLRGEELRCWIQIQASVQRCQRTLQEFEGELEGIHGRVRFDTLRRALLAARLLQKNATVDRFNQNVQTHSQTMTINFLCLQTYANNVVVHMLETIIQGGDQYLLQRMPIADPAGISDNVNGKSEASNDVLQNLRDTVSVARSVVDSISRPPSPQEGQTQMRVRSDSSSSTSELMSPLPPIREDEDDPEPGFDDTTPLEILSPLIDNLSRYVRCALHDKEYGKAQMYQLEKIECLEERRAAYSFWFDKEDAQETLAKIYRDQSNEVEADKIYRELIKNHATASDLVAEDAPPPLQEPLEPAGNLRKRSRYYRSLAALRLRRCSEPESPHLVDLSAKFAKRAVTLLRRSLRDPTEPNMEFEETVRLLVRILEEQGRGVAADTYRQVYLKESESSPLTQTLLPTGPPRIFDVDALDAKGLTPLVSAIKDCEAWRVYYLLQLGANAGKVCENKAPVMHAVERDGPTIVRILKWFWPGLDLEVRDAEGRTLLAIASQKGSVSMIEALIDVGAKIEAVTNYGVTPLMLAARHGQAAAVETLIHKGANCLAKSQCGWSVVHYAVHGSCGARIIQLLHDRGVDINEQCDTDSRRPLHIAVKLYWENATKRDTLHALLACKDVDMNASDKGNNTPLSLAAEQDDECLVKLLIANGAIYDKEIPQDLPQNIVKILKAQGAVLQRKRSDTESSFNSLRFWKQ
ncbi:MAG: hypothetical protein M1813_000991 [Trichoglossum hirsutum]|nr:MAG: hypothetical protein M1813_000991 [Trichoglossum hirsutum]